MSLLSLGDLSPCSPRLDVMKLNVLSVALGEMLDARMGQASFAAASSMSFADLSMFKACWIHVAAAIIV